WRRNGFRLWHGLALLQALEVFDAPGVNSGADQFMLPLQPLGEHLRVVACCDQIVIRRALAGEDRAADIDERQNDGRGQSFIFGLNVINRPVMFDVCVESGNHGGIGPAELWAIEATSAESGPCKARPK